MALHPFSGDSRRPSTADAAPSYFTAAAIRAGYAVAAHPLPAAHRDALHRELHDERVREDYFAREIAHSRRLLDQRLRHSLAPIYPSRTEFGPTLVPPQRVERLPHFLDARVDGRQVERRLGYTRTPAALRPEAVIRKQRPLAKRSVVSRVESTLPQKLSGIKRKAATTEAANDPPQQDKKWSCSLCQVFTTSEQDLKSHLQGQKHKVVQESRSSESKVADKSLPADGLKKVNTNTAKESFSCDVCKLKCNSQSMLNSHLGGKRHKEGLLNSQSKVPEKTGEQSKVADKVLPVDGSKQVNTLLSTNHAPEEQKQSNPVSKEQKLFCEVCKVKCTSQSDLNSHFNGKRHKESLTLLAKEPSNVTSAGTSKEVDKKTKQGVQQKQVLKSKRKNLTDLKSPLNGKKHKAQLEELNKVQDDKRIASEDKKLANDKPAKEEVQSFDCDDCKLKCNSLSNLKSHLNGKKHKAQLEELNKVKDDERANDQPATAEQSGKDSSSHSVEDSGKSSLVNAAETKLASDKPATAEQSGNDKENKSGKVKVEVSGEDGGLVA